MADRLQPAGRRRLGAVLAGVLLLAMATAACDPVTAAGGGDSAGAVQSAAQLGSCPELSRGQAGQAACVKALQQALQASGYPSQPVNGVFGAITEHNLRDFQRRHGIQPATGVFGPRTRAVLAGGGGSADPVVPPTTMSSYSARRTYCADSACRLYLRRSTTRRYARLVADHPRIAAVVVGAILGGACQVLRLRSASTLCSLVAGSYADDVGDDLQAAARQDACLRVTLGPTSGPKGTWKLLDSDPDNGPRCAS